MLDCRTRTVNRTPCWALGGGVLLEPVVAAALCDIGLERSRRRQVRLTLLRKAFATFDDSASVE
jgi:hypothetical protein